MDYLTGGVVALCGLGLGAVWRLAKSLSLLGDLRQIALRNQEDASSLRAELKAMGERQDKNFHELGTAWVEMKCKIGMLEEKAHGRSTEWRSSFGRKD